MDDIFIRKTIVVVMIVASVAAGIYYLSPTKEIVVQKQVQKEINR